MSFEVCSVFKFALSSSASYFTFSSMKISNIHKSRGVSWTPEHPSLSYNDHDLLTVILHLSFRALREIVLWAVTTVLFSTTAKQKNADLSEPERTVRSTWGLKCCGEMGFVRKWQLSRSHVPYVGTDTWAPRAVTRAHVLPRRDNLRKKASKSTEIAKKQMSPWACCFPLQRKTKNLLEWTK